jgi:hypothetical protein
MQQLVFTGVAAASSAASSPGVFVGGDLNAVGEDLRIADTETGRRSLGEENRNEQFRDGTRIWRKFKRKILRYLLSSEFRRVMEKFKYVKNS